MSELAILGGGRMGTALLAGLLRSGFVSMSQCVVVEKRPEARKALAERFPDVQVLAHAVPADAVVLAVKPSDVEAACRELEAEAYRRVLSIVAGARTAQLEQWLWPGAVVIRAMPNAPALLGSSASAIAAGTAAGSEDLAWAEAVLSSIGVVVKLPEHLLDAATGLSGSGPAYIFLVAEALVEAGVLVGLDREVSTVLITQTILGAARLLAESGDSPEALRHAVTSPGGTTAAGLHALESAGVRAAILDAVLAATTRSALLGGTDADREGFDSAAVAPRQQAS